jgi:futalosine hydrolase
MNILLVSATKLEIEPFLKEIGADIHNSVFSPHVYRNHSLYILITGVGIAHTSFYLGKYLSGKFDLAINAGICGSFNPHLKLGEVVNVTEDYFADLGAEDGEKFLSIDELGLPGAYYVRNENSCVMDRIKQVRGVTVNTTHGSDASIQKFSGRIKADVESMEGAAFLWACNAEKVKCIQLRAISNYVEKRDRSKWQIGPAVKNLNESLISVLSFL